jgi:tetratricopeptide (TPR) repeat protein
MGYSPLGQEGLTAISSTTGEGERSGHVLNPAILIKIGKAASNRSDYQTALDCYTKSLEIDPGNTEAAFLLRRVKYIIEEDQPKTIDSQDEAETEPEPQKGPRGMLPMQEEKTIKIKPKLQQEVSPELREQDPTRVYHVEESDDGRELEEVSKHMAREAKKSATKRKRNMGLAAGILVILMMIILLWYFGFLKL